jgi:hypothetical protein
LRTINNSDNPLSFLVLTRAASISPWRTTLSAIRAARRRFARAHVSAICHRGSGREPLQACASQACCIDQTRFPFIGNIPRCSRLRSVARLPRKSWPRRRTTIGIAGVSSTPRNPGFFLASRLGGEETAFSIDTVTAKRQPTKRVVEATGIEHTVMRRLFLSRARTQWIFYAATAERS